MKELREKFALLSPSHPQLGIDDTPINTNTSSRDSFLHHKLSKGSKVLERGILEEVREFAQTGVHPSQRAACWRILLHLPLTPTQQEETTLLSLLQESEEIEYIVDELFLMDVEHLGDDEKYFVFVDEMRDMVLAFSRDASIPIKSSYRPHSPLFTSLSSSTLIGSRYEEKDVISVPPSGVQPFLGFANYIAPICYSTNHLPSIYSLLVQMWQRCWCKAHAISSDHGAIIHVLLTFQAILSEFSFFG